MIDPSSGTAEPCAKCASLASKGVGAMGIVLLIAGIAAVVGVAYSCVRTFLFGETTMLCAITLSVISN